MTRRSVFLLLGLGLAALLVTPALSCTTVCLLHKGQTVVAYNYDFYPSEGLVLVNKRGSRKVSAVRTQGASWTAAYVEASFTKTPFLQEVPAAAREAFAAHPGATSSCAAPS